MCGGHGADGEVVVEGVGDFGAFADGESRPLDDGQQRTISICQFVAGEFSIPIDGVSMYFHNLQDDRRREILDYPLMVYVCEGTDSEKLEWFKTINIAGEELTEQELRNAVYHGPWTASAKPYFSKTGCPAYAVGSKYLTGTPIPPEVLKSMWRSISRMTMRRRCGLIFRG